MCVTLCQTNGWFPWFTYMQFRFPISVMSWPVQAAILRSSLAFRSSNVVQHKEVIVL